MKKQSIMMAVLSAAAVITAAAPELVTPGTINTVYAKDIGWVQEDDTWRYYEDADYYLTDSWKKDGNDWYYLDENGNRAVNQQIDDFYVNEEGKKVMNQWVSIENDTDWDNRDMPEYYWYYYGKNGALTTSKFQKINENWYYFDESGRMTTGRVDIEGSTYYFGDSEDGIMKTGWMELENEMEELDETTSWYYFDENGKMLVNQVDKKINGDYYTFENGIMQTGWFLLPEETATASEAAISLNNYRYYDADSGKRVTGFCTIEGVPGISAEDETYTFYFKNGKAYASEDQIQIFTIDSKKYGFNTKGEMQTDLKSVTLEGGSILNYYFGSDGVLRSGKQSIYNEDLGENQTWFFYTEGTRKGQGFHGIRDNNIYIYGLRQDADADVRYSAVNYEGNQYLVNTSGVIQKASSSSKSAEKPDLGTGFRDMKDSNGTIWVVDINGIIQS